MARNNGSAPIQALGIITKHGDFFHRHRGNYFPDCGEVRDFYKNRGWEVLVSYEEERLMIARHRDGSPMRNIVSFLVVQRL